MSLLLSRIEAAPTTFSYTGSGGILFDGTAEVSRTITVTGTGGFTLDGTAGLSITVVPLQSGGAAFGGSAATEFISAAIVATPSGGGGWISRTAGRVFSRATVVPVARVYQYAPSGGLRLGGAAPTSFTASPRLRREEEELVLLMALLG